MSAGKVWWVKITNESMSLNALKKWAEDAQPAVRKLRQRLAARTKTGTRPTVHNG